ncbi:hypothetical protein K2P97_02925 [bacterium]|nr:hypothetical protein [bacterium]
MEPYRMNRVFEQIRFTVESTKDGSPTLRLPDLGEWMHHSAGAASETLYIYKSVIDKGLDALSSSKTCVVGLGLGYIEISWALGLLERVGYEPVPLKHQITSFEIVPELKEHFSEWLNQDSDLIYDQISDCFKITVDQKKSIKNILAANYKLLPMQSDITTYGESTRWNIICYDAYSSKTSQQLWSEEFLNTFLKNHADESCVLTTYACTGNLKRALEANGFQIIRRTAYNRIKGHSTLAFRGPSFNAEMFM